MTQNRRDWDLELEESAQGSDSFIAPGAALQFEEARESATEWAAGDADATVPSQRVEKARVRRRLLGDAMTDLEEPWHDRRPPRTGSTRLPRAWSSSSVPSRSTSR